VIFCTEEKAARPPPSATRKNFKKTQKKSLFLKIMRAYVRGGVAAASCFCA